MKLLKQKILKKNKRIKQNLKEQIWKVQKARQKAQQNIIKNIQKVEIKQSKIEVKGTGINHLLYYKKKIYN